MNNVVEAIIEIPMGTRNKFEISKETGKIKLDRVLFSALSYPGEYGFIDNTLSNDGDPLDILIVSSFSTYPGCIVDARIIGYLEVIDNGFKDEKLIAVVDKDPRFEQINNIEDLAPHIKMEIKDFFGTYKSLQGIKVETNDFKNKEQALTLLQEAYDRYKNKK